MEKTALTLDIDPEFIRRDSLYYASDKEGIEELHKEYYYLQKHGFNVDLLTEKQISERYSFKKDVALYLYNDAEINPFKYNHGLLLQAHKKGVRIFENTKISGKKLQKEMATFFTENGHSIQARYVIIAAGYEGLEIKNEKNSVLTSSYAVITTPVDSFENWNKQTLIWETARPYIYMRTTKDRRIIIGGLDENTTDPKERDAKIMHKKGQLIEEFHKLFPAIEVHPDYYISAFYGGTHDGLPMIGEYEELPNCYFLFAFGDNGLVYSGVLAKKIRDVITTGSHPSLTLYHQTRV